MTKDETGAGEGMVGSWYPDWDFGVPPYRSFEKVSRDLLEGYRTLADQGMLPATVALAMLNATVNLYEIFDMRGQLPGILRAIADRLEGGAQLS